MDSKWCVRYSGFNIRVYSHILASAELSSAGIPAVLCADHIHDPCIRYRVMVSGVFGVVLMEGWDIGFIAPQRIMSSAEMLMRLSSSAAS